MQWGPLWRLARGRVQLCAGIDQQRQGGSAASRTREVQGRPTVIVVLIHVCLFSQQHCYDRCVSSGNGVVERGPAIFVFAVNERSSSLRGQQPLQLSSVAILHGRL